jgi:hypothetical protein
MKSHEEIKEIMAFDPLDAVEKATGEDYNMEKRILFLTVQAESLTKNFLTSGLGGCRLNFSSFFCKTYLTKTRSVI